MIMRAHLLRRGFVLALFTASLALAQTFPLQMVAVSGSTVITLANGQQVPFVSSVGVPLTVQVTATYAGSGTINIKQAPQVLGSNEFTDALSGTLPITLTPGQSFSFSLTFTPTSAVEATAIFNLPFTETVPTAGSNTPTVNSNAINLSLVGSAASYVLSYIKAGNVIPLANGQTIQFDPQPINTTVTLTLNISDNGSADGEVTGLSISGKDFQFIGKPLLPVGISPSQPLQVGIEYTPTAVEADTGQVTINLVDGTSRTVNLAGSGTAPTLVYTVIQNGKSTTVTPNGAITFPNTNVGSSASIEIRVQNTGNATATVNSVSAVGQGFSVSQPPVLPQTLATNASFNFTIAFSPTSPGTVNGQLLVGTDLFTLAGTGLGSNLQFSYVASGTTLVIGTNGINAVVFSPVQVTKSGSIPFTVTNNGTVATVISNIAVAGTNSPFSITGGPALPKTLAPGGSFSFTVNFAPTTTSLASDTLLINTTAIPLSGSGTAPPPLPAYTISGPSGNVAAQSQPSVSLKLASPYPVALNGVLTLTTSGALTADPAVQFQTQGRTVAFTIPANGTVANFAGQGTQIGLQTGTVASTITLSPTFTTAAGDIPLTPANPTTLQFAVPAAAPVLIAASEVSSNASSVVLSFTGYSTTRTLTALNLQFTAAAGFNLASSQITVDLTQAAQVWFSSTTSPSFGGQFTVTVPFTFAGTVPTGKTLIGTIASVSATITNEVGTSNSVSSPIQ